MIRSSVRSFWNWQACREYIQATISHYNYAPKWFIDWLEDLYLRLDEKIETVTINELEILARFHAEDDDSWEPESYAVNRVYKFFKDTGRDTTGIVGY
jgi:hypothetical protein